MSDIYNMVQHFLNICTCSKTAANLVVSVRRVQGVPKVLLHPFCGVFVILCYMVKLEKIACLHWKITEKNSRCRRTLIAAGTRLVLLSLYPL